MSKMSNKYTEPFDFLEDQNKLFYVNFDILTQRSHFMILPKDHIDINQDFSRMPDDQRNYLIEASQATLALMQESFRIPGLILSLHRGSWFKKTFWDRQSGELKDTTFHAHLCVVDDDRYLAVFEAKKDIPNVKNSPFWTKKNTLGNYSERVKNYVALNKYHKDEVKEIKDIKDVSDPPALPKVDDIDTVFHPSHPKIGFVGKKKDQKALDLLRLIDEFAREILKWNLTKKEEGYHVCLHLGDVDTADWKYGSKEGKEVLGFILLSSPFFFRLWQSEEQRKQWFSEYQKSEFKPTT